MLQIDIDILLDESKKRLEKLREETQFEEMHYKLLHAKKEEMLQSPDSLKVKQLRPVKTNGGHRAAGSLVKGSLTSHMIEVFRAEGKPMRAPKIAERLKARGYDTKAKSGLSVSVSTTLAHHRDKYFKKIKTGIYDLLER